MARKTRNLNKKAASVKAEVKPNPIPAKVLPMETDRVIKGRPNGKAKGAVALDRFKTMDMTNMAYGTDQVNHNAPLEVPLGFTTQIPFQSPVNATIIANPSPIPIRNYYSIMLSDPVVYASVLYLITQIMARIGDYNNPDDEEEQELVRNTIKRVGKKKLLKHLCTSIYIGFADVKLNWGVIDNITQIKSIQALPQDSILLAVTPEGELDPQYGVMQYYYNINSAWMQQPNAYSSQGNAPLAAYGSNMTPYRQLTYNFMYLTAIPEDWVLHHVFNPTGLDGNKYGVSIIQPIYQDITAKANQWARIGIASTYKAAPMLLMKIDHQVQVDLGNGEYEPLIDNIEKTMGEASSTGYLLINSKNGVEHHVIDNSADLEKMLRVIDAYNHEIRTGLITPNLVGNAGSYANAQANNESNNDIIINFTDDIIASLLILRDKIRKFGLDDADRPEYSTGYFELLDNSLEDKAVWAKIIEAAKNVGVIDITSLDDINFMRKHIGLPAINELTDDMIYNMAMAMGGIPSGNKTNINKTKQEVGVPYANGGVKQIKDTQYGS